MIVFLTVFFVVWIICDALEDCRNSDIAEKLAEVRRREARRHEAMAEARKAVTFTPQKNGGWEAEERSREFYRRQGYL